MSKQQLYKLETTLTQISNLLLLTKKQKNKELFNSLMKIEAEIEWAIMCIQREENKKGGE